MDSNDICERTAVITRDNPSDVTANSNTLTGYAIVYNAKSKLIVENGQRFYEKIDKGAFTQSIASRNVTFVFKHDDDAEFGDTQSKTLRLTEDDHGIRFELDLPTYANALRSKVQSKLVTGMSFSFKPTEVYSDGEGIRHVKKGELYHISPVYNPAYPQTKVGIREELPNHYKYKLRLAEME